MGWQKGDVVVKAEPFAHVLSQHQRGTRCDSCFLRAGDLKRCTACKVVRYCNSSCQRKDWQIHREECRCLQMVAPKVPTESVRLMLRILIRIQRGEDTQLDWDCARWRGFMDLQSHVEEIKQDPKRSEVFTHMTFTLGELAGNSVKLPTSQELLEVYGKMVINTYSICDGEMQPIGSGLYISPSLLDHSCLPNAVAVFSGTTLTVHCVTDIPSDDPRQVFLSYVDQLAPSCERRRQLEEQYYFTCECPRCLDTHLDGLMLSIHCPQTNCDGVVLAASNEGQFQPCQLCKSAVSDKAYISTVHKIMQESRDAIQKLDDQKKTGEDPEARLRLCEDLIQIQPVLSPYNVYRVKTLDRAMDACIDACHWQQAAEYGEQTIKAYFKLHPPCSPTVGIQLLKLGKLQLYLQQLPAAMISLQQAESILVVTHGRSHEIYTELCELLDQCVEQRRTEMDQGDS